MKITKFREKICANLNIGLVAGVLLTGNLFAQETGWKSPWPPEWSKDATSLYARKEGKIKILSPDKKKVVVVQGISISVFQLGKHLQGADRKHIESPLAELIWSMSSDAFAVTESDGGAVGHWYVMVYLLKDGFVCGYDIGKKAIKSFKKYYQCEPSEDANAGAVEWLKGGTQLLLVTEVPPHSDCREMGMLRGYIVEVPSGKILKEYDEEELLSKCSNHFGERLLGDERNRKK